jgi:hypothetical protein
MMNLTIDRIEEGIAVLIGREDETVRMTVPVSQLPPGSQEGDIIRLILEKDEPATTAARERVGGLISRLRKS